MATGKGKRAGASHEGNGSTGDKGGSESVRVAEFTLAYGGHRWADYDLLGAHASLVAGLLGRDVWEVANPRSGPQALQTWLAVLEASATGRDVFEIMAEVQSMPLADILACVEV